MVVIKSHAEFETHLGKEIGVSNWHKITQEQINHFADATLDHQWIHVDVERAERESPLNIPLRMATSRFRLFPISGSRSAMCRILKWKSTTV